MEQTVVEGLRTLKFDLVLTLALAAIFLFVGSLIQKRVGFLSRSSIPAAVIGGLLFALVALTLRTTGTLGVTIDTSLRAPLQTAFYTTIGLSATLALLRAGGWRTGFFWMLASVTGVVQNIVGLLLAYALGAPLMLGIICGALTLTGGLSTGLAWADRFETWGIGGAGAVIAASATFGIFVASLVGNPVATVLIRRFKLAPEQRREQSSIEEEEFWALSPTIDTSEERAGQAAAAAEAAREREALTGAVLLHNLLVILLLMGAGALVGQWISRTGLVLPGYIGALVLGAIVRNADERFRWFGLNERAVEVLGGIALALFLMIALMSLELWKLVGLAGPMLVILAVQIVVMIVYAVAVTFVLMGRDYEAAVTASGHIGFGLGITPNAVANMEALSARYAPAPRSFLVVPVVGGFFIDLSNLLIITLFTNLLLRWI